MGPMGIAANHIDRLLPRHESADSIDLSWNVRVPRTGLFRTRTGEEISDRATIRDISLEGALIELADSHEHEVGEHIPVRFRGLDGEAVIRHCRPGESDTLLYGVRFLPNPVFNDAVSSAVGELRGHSAELSRAWQRRN